MIRMLHKAGDNTSFAEGSAASAHVFNESMNDFRTPKSYLTHIVDRGEGSVITHQTEATELISKILDF